MRAGHRTWLWLTVVSVALVGCEDAAPDATQRLGADGRIGALSDAARAVDSHVFVIDGSRPDGDGAVNPDDGATAAGDRGIEPPAPGDGGLVDGGGVYTPDGGPPVDPDLCPAGDIVPLGCIDAVESESAMGLCDGFDNDCDRVIDEDCFCKIGDVQRCFAGPPGRVEVGACVRGTQRCVTRDDGVRVWGPCEGGVPPTVERCDGLDNDCNGCVDEIFGCDPDGNCPGPGDPRVPDAAPFVAYPLRGGDFYAGEARAWRWTVEGGACDELVEGRRSFTLENADQENAVLTPLLSGSYRVTLRVTTPDGEFVCTWVIDATAPGVRVEMCYPESTTQDVDLLIMRNRDQANWYGLFGSLFPNPNACSWWNCEAMLRGAVRRVDWGYVVSPLEACVGGPQGGQWRGLGSCANPRLDIDNNLEEGIGLPENINLDNPAHGEQFRIMLHNFTGRRANPIVNVYCGGRLEATYGAPPDQVPNFAGAAFGIGFGAMWRVADVTAEVDENGVTTGCAVDAVHPPGANAGYDVSQEDPRF